MIRTLAKVLPALALSFILVSTALAKENERSLAIEAVRNVETDCKECVFFAVPAKSGLIKNHFLFFVSTMGRIPPPFWTVAVSKKGKTYILDAKNTSGWNSMFKGESVFLSTDERALLYIREFLQFAVGKSIYIDQLTSDELKRVQKNSTASQTTSTKIVRGKERIGLLFFSKDVSQTLQFWNLIVNPSGQIIKADLREF